jgi:hypothetical protein
MFDEHTSGPPKQYQFDPDTGQRFRYHREMDRNVIYYLVRFEPHYYGSEIGRYIRAIEPGERLAREPTPPKAVEASALAGHLPEGFTVQRAHSQGFKWLH